MNRVRRILHAEKAFERGICGKGIGVAILDTGAYPHEDFKERIRYFYDFVNGKKKCYDDCSHGTHVCGITGGDGRASAGKYRGIAPECDLIVLKVLDRQGNGRKEDVLNGMDWVIQNKEKYQIRVLNISVGTTREGMRTETKLTEKVEQAWDAGLVVVVAAGNRGPAPHSITVPGNSRKVITVGSSDDCTRLPGSGMRFCYSGRGPTEECVCKPDLTAPGSMILSCNAPMYGNSGAYGVKSGTSMATPVVSGAVALLLSQEPELSNVEVKMRLREAAVDLGLPRGQQGWGQLDIVRLLRL